MPAVTAPPGVLLGPLKRFGPVGPVGPKHEAGPALRLLDDGDSMIGTTLIGPDEKAQDRWTSRGEDPLAR